MSFVKRTISPYWSKQCLNWLCREIGNIGSDPLLKLDGQQPLCTWDGRTGQPCEWEKASINWCRIGASTVCLKNSFCLNKLSVMLPPAQVELCVGLNVNLVLVWQTPTKSWINQSSSKHHRNPCMPRWAKARLTGAPFLSPFLSSAQNPATFRSASQPFLYRGCRGCQEPAQLTVNIQSTQNILCSDSFTFCSPPKKKTQRVELRPANTLGTPLPLPSPLASPGLQNGAPAVVATTHVPAVPGLAHGQHPDPTWRSRSDPSRAGARERPSGAQRGATNSSESESR